MSEKAHELTGQIDTLPEVVEALLYLSLISAPFFAGAVWGRALRSHYPTYDRTSH